MAASSSSSTAAEGGGALVSEKRTVLFPLVVCAEVRRDFLVGDGEDVVVGFALVAWAKSAARLGSLGCVRVDAVDGEEKPWNWEVRSSNCFWRLGRESAMVAAFL